MNDLEVARLLREDDEDLTDYGSPVFQDRVFIIMWQSSRSGGTYTELRKSVRGRNRFLMGLKFLGVDLREVKVFEQTKSWIPERKSESKQKDNKVKEKKNARTKTVVHTGRRQHNTVSR